MEKLIANVTSRMIDKDLARLFENAYPNTLGISPQEHAYSRYNRFKVQWNPLSYVITGDIQRNG